MVELVKSLLGNSGFVSVSCAVLAAIMSFYIFRASRPTDLIKERHDKLISPLFKILEPHLYKNDITDEKINMCLAIYSANKNLVDGKLRYAMYIFSENHCFENYTVLCSCVSSQYDKCCRKLGIKLRTFEY